MSFISYAQNFEDVMLLRALKHVGKGFYIDIGAQDPIVDSVSLAFYERGWRGVHVEPTLQYSDKLRMARPDETVLQVAIGNQTDTLTFYEFNDTGLSTADSDIARRHQQAGFQCHETTVPVLSLDYLFECIGVRDIHWLKLDVEGFEKSVLESWKRSFVLPWVLVIESTRPLTQEESYGEWEPLILSKGYRFVYFDGLNRFYVSSEHDGLASAFFSPPNIFDGFVLSGSASQPFYKLVDSKAQQASERAVNAEAQAQQASERAVNAEAQAQQAIERAVNAEAQAQQAIERAVNAEAQAQQASERAASAEAQAQQASERAVSAASALTAVHKSSSWRITAPFRMARRIVCTFSNEPLNLKLSIKTKAKLLLAHASLYVNRRPKLRHAAMAVLARFPSLKTRLKVATMNRYFAQSIAATVSIELENLTPRARRIYADLKTAIDRRQKENG